MKKATFSLEHPILFVDDFSNQDIVIPEHSPERVVSATPSCLSINTIADVDGEISVTLISEGEAQAPPEFFTVFEGKLATPNRKVAVVTSEDKKTIEIDVKKRTTNIKVSVNDTTFPSDIWIQAK